MSKIADKMFSSSDELAKKAQVSYFNWLCHLVWLDEFDGRTYNGLAHILHGIEFYSIVPLDHNREQDGIRLRSTWLEIMDEQADALGIGRPVYPETCLQGPCSVLEMMVALAMRLEADIMQNDEYGPRAAVWFWEMMSNLRLFWLDDSRLDGDIQVKTVIETVLDRRYDRNGNGGLFPLRSAEEDQTNVEIWWQAQAWLKENYQY